MVLNAMVFPFCCDLGTKKPSIAAGLDPCVVGSSYQDFISSVLMEIPELVRRLQSILVEKREGISCPMKQAHHCHKICSSEGEETRLIEGVCSQPATTGRISSMSLPIGLLVCRSVLCLAKLPQKIPPVSDGSRGISSPLRGI